MFYFMAVMTFICVINIFIMLFVVCRLLKEIIGTAGDE